MNKLKLGFQLGPVVALIFSATHSNAAFNTNGFAVKFTSADDKVSDVMVLPNLWLYVESGQPTTPFLPPEKFTAVFEGSISGDLRANYFFKAEELGGALKLEVNNTVVLDTSTPGTVSKAVQINKGANAIKATFIAPAQGDTFLRVGWMEKGTNAVPIPNSLITHITTPELQKAETIYLGRELFLEYRCAKCHSEKFATPVPELAMDAPALDGIGARRNYEWLAQWILNPKATRASVHMPRLLHGTKAKEDAEAMAAYLATLKTERPATVKQRTTPFDHNTKALDEITKRSGINARTLATDATETPADNNQEHQPIFERLHCTGCHNTPGSSEIDPVKISLQHVAQKFSAGSLVEFLKAPEKSFAWIRMPNFKLADAEAKELSEFLLKNADSAGTKSVPTDKAIVDRGRQLVQNSGCLNCHAVAKLENKNQVPTLAAIAANGKGCLAEIRNDQSKAPDFDLNARERESLTAFLKTDHQSLDRYSPIEFATRETRLLKCNACHGQIDLVPPLDVLGGKLKPEWAAAFIGGDFFKIRADKHPKGELWVEARMPAFQSRAGLLAQGMAMQQGYPPETPPDGPLNEEAAGIGHKLLGMDGGLSCINCHAVNDLPALAVFESEGINLGLSNARLLKPYFFRWLRSPLSVDPQTKMPAYFEDGRSALPDYYDGDAEKQINALYEYIRAGEKMAAPATGQ